MGWRLLFSQQTQSHFVGWFTIVLPMDVENVKYYFKNAETNDFQLCSLTVRSCLVLSTPLIGNAFASEMTINWSSILFQFLSGYIHIWCKSIFYSRITYTKKMRSHTRRTVRTCVLRRFSTATYLSFRIIFKICDGEMGNSYICPLERCGARHSQSRIYFANGRKKNDEQQFYSIFSLYLFFSRRVVFILMP